MKMGEGVDGWSILKNEDCPFNTVVTTPLNRYHGVAIVAPDGKQLVHAYLGVPYAQTPQRFAPAQPVQKTDKSITDYDATSKIVVECSSNRQNDKIPTNDLVGKIINCLLWLNFSNNQCSAYCKNTHLNGRNCVSSVFLHHFLR